VRTRCAVRTRKSASVGAELPWVTLCATLRGSGGVLVHPGRARNTAHFGALLLVATPFAFYTRAGADDMVASAARRASLLPRAAELAACAGNARYCAGMIGIGPWRAALTQSPWMAAELSSLAFLARLGRHCASLRRVSSLAVDACAVFLVPPRRTGCADG
jgi:hypothetical protein